MIDEFSITLPYAKTKRRRKVYVYLPTDYDSSDRRYPVLYMFDGQNLFSDEEATYGKSWGLSAYLDYTDTPLIVASIECNTDRKNGRLKEYSPFDFSDPEFGNIPGYGKETMDYLTTVFKAKIDKRYRTLPDRVNTFISGSSMGGLMTIYAMTDYSDSFSRGAALSPSLWTHADIIRDMISSSPRAHESRIFLDYGEDEMEKRSKMASDFGSVVSAFIESGYVTLSRIVPHGDHSEASWEREVPFFIPFLLEE